jgi:hypothetical protein
MSAGNEPGTKAYREAAHQEWIDWFMDPQTTSENGIRLSLMTVPPGRIGYPWLRVWEVLTQTLHDAKGEGMAEAANAEAAEVVLDRKARLVGEEDRRRRQQEPQ